MNDLISRQDAKDMIKNHKSDFSTEKDYRTARACVNAVPSVQPEDWMERNKERILQAGMEGREIEFRIGGRLFAIREKAQ